MTRPASLLLLALTFLAPWLHAETPPATDPFAKWEAEIAAFEHADKSQPPQRGGIVFTGSSSIRLWKTLAQDLPRHRVLNRGFGGSQIIDSTHFADRILLPYAPRMVVLYAGGNDLASGRTPAGILADFQAFAQKVRTALPDAEIAYISIAGNPARWAQVERVKAANALIADYIARQPRMKFIDVFSRMLGEDGLPRPELFVADRLHMNEEGYKIWTAAIAPLLPAPDKPQ